MKSGKQGGRATPVEVPVYRLLKGFNIKKNRLVRGQNWYGEMNYWKFELRRGEMEEANEAINGRIFVAMQVDIGTIAVEGCLVVVIQKVMYLFQNGHLHDETHQQQSRNSAICDFLFQTS